MEIPTHQPSAPEAFVQEIQDLLQKMMEGAIDTGDMELSIAITNGLDANTRLLLAVLGVTDETVMGQAIDLDGDGYPEEEHSSAQVFTEKLMALNSTDKLTAMELLKTMSLDEISPTLLNELLVEIIEHLTPGPEMDLEDLARTTEQEILGSDSSLEPAARYLEIYYKGPECWTEEEGRELDRLKDSPELSEALEKLDTVVAAEIRNRLIDKLTELISKPAGAPTAEA